MATNGFRELGDVTECPEEPSTFTSKDFRLVRHLLRVISLWRPRSAGVFERYVYPITVNLLLLLFGFLRNLIQVVYTDHSWLSIQSLYLVHEVCIWLGHICGNYYFRSGDLDSVLPRHQWCCSRETLKRKAKVLKKAMILSLVIFCGMMCTVYAVTQIWGKKESERFSSDLPGIRGVIDHVFFVIVFLTIVYDIGIGLALSWTMWLLYVCYTTRLKGLEQVFLKWRKPCNEAVYFFQVFYSQPIQHSWKRISWWFLVNNIVAIAIPLYGYQLAQALSGNAYQSKHIHYFVIYLSFVLTIWLTPIIVVEQIKRREKKFQENVNNFCFGLLKDAQVPITSNDVTRPPRDRGPNEILMEDGEQYTFASRGKELRDFIRFLKYRRLGLVGRGYALQLNVSVISLFVGIVSFLVQFHRDEFVTGNAISPVNTTIH